MEGKSVDTMVNDMFRIVQLFSDEEFNLSEVGRVYLFQYFDQVPNKYKEDVFDQLADVLREHGAKLGDEFSASESVVS